MLFRSPDHKKKFFIGVYFDDKLLGKGEGSSKHEAELSAAENALSEFNLKIDSDKKEK